VCEFLEPFAFVLVVEVVHSTHDAADDTRNLVAVLAEVGVVAHQRSHDGTDIGVALVFHAFNSACFSASRSTRSRNSSFITQW